MSFEILAGLPPYGPAAEQFSATGEGTHREGLVVEFLPPEAAPWIGNFQRGLTPFDTVVELPGTTEVLVVAGGTAYVVSPSKRLCLRTFGAGLRAALRFGDAVVLSDGLSLEALRGGGVQWRTPRISWDGFRNLRIEGTQALGDAWNAPDDAWTPFAVDLETGEVTCGGHLPESPGYG